MKIKIKTEKKKPQPAHTWYPARRCRKMHAGFSADCSYCQSIHLRLLRHACPSHHTLTTRFAVGLPSTSNAKKCLLRIEHIPKKKKKKLAWAPRKSSQRTIRSIFALSISACCATGLSNYASKKKKKKKPYTSPDKDGEMGQTNKQAITLRTFNTRMIVKNSREGSWAEMSSAKPRLFLLRMMRMWLRGKPSSRSDSKEEPYFFFMFIYLFIFSQLPSGFLHNCAESVHVVFGMNDKSA